MLHLLYSANHFTNTICGASDPTLTTTPPGASTTSLDKGISPDIAFDKPKGEAASQRYLPRAGKRSKACNISKFLRRS